MGDEGARNARCFGALCNQPAVAEELGIMDSTLLVGGSLPFETFQRMPAGLVGLTLLK